MTPKRIKIRERAGVSLRPAHYEALKALSQETQRSMANIIEKAIEVYARQHGLTLADEGDARARFVAEQKARLKAKQAKMEQDARRFFS